MTFHPYTLHHAPRKPFTDTDEAALRRRVRGVIRRSRRLSANARGVLEYIVNLWFVHRRDAGFIHPGRDRLAEKTGLSVATIKRFLGHFKRLGWIRAIGFAKGGRKATRYAVDMDRIEVELTPGEMPTVQYGELAEMPRNAGVSSPEAAADQVVKTGSKRPTVYSSAQRIDGGTASDHHPAFMPLGWFDEVLAMLEDGEGPADRTESSQSLAKSWGIAA